MENKENSKEIVVRRTIESIISEISQKKITNDDEYRKMGEWLKKVKQTQKLVDETFDGERKRKYEEYKAVQKKTVVRTEKSFVGSSGRRRQSRDNVNR